MTILPNIEEAMEDARNGKLSPYWQNDLYRECHRQKLSDEEQQALSELERICPKLHNGAAKKNCIMTWRTSAAESGTATTGRNTTPWCS